MTQQQYTHAPDGYTCTYCFHVFKRELSFERHKCDAMEREMQLHSARGQNAFTLYNKWLVQKRRNPVNKKTFGASKSFSALYKFARWKNDVKIPDVNKYIIAMVMWDIQPIMWTRDDVYAKYIDFIDSVSTVEDHLKYTYQTLVKVSETVECPLNEVFQHLELYMVIEYIQARKLSPWVILKIEGFKTFFSSLSPLQKQKLQSFVRPAYWRKRLLENPEETYMIEQFIQQVKL